MTGRRKISTNAPSALSTSPASGDRYAVLHSSAAGPRTGTSSTQIGTVAL